MLGLDSLEANISSEASAEFAFKVPHAFAQRMVPGDPHDPLLRQVLATSDEMLRLPGYEDDPLQETGAANTRPGIIHKYRGRALLLLTGTCAINCRYCFRRHFPYEDNRNGREQWQQALDYIREDESITEVILSGGDPLVPGDDYLHNIVSAIANIEHVNTLRMHSRLPIVLPARITPDLREAICSSHLKVVLVIHCNHAQEIDGDVHNALQALRDWGVTLLNQAVLLAGVNDSAEAQIDLSHALHGSGVLPYYLHLLDPVRGAQHFDVSEPAAQDIIREITKELPGYLVPRLVREVPGESSKRAIPIDR